MQFLPQQLPQTALFTFKRAQEGGNIYIINDSATYVSSTINNYTDQVVQLTGTPNISAPTVSGTTIHL